MRLLRWSHICTTLLECNIYLPWSRKSWINVLAYYEKNLMCLVCSATSFHDPFIPSRVSWKIKYSFEPCRQCCRLSPKMVEQTLVSHKYHFQASFGQILKFAYFRLIAQIKSLKSSNGCFGLLIHKGNGCEVGRAQKIFDFSGHPTQHPLKGAASYC